MTTTSARPAPTYRIASIPGDGIGPEVVSAAIQVVEALSRATGTFRIEFTHIPWGTQYYKEHGRYVSSDCLDTLRQFDASLFGAVGAPGTLERERKKQKIKASAPVCS